MGSDCSSSLSLHIKLVKSILFSYKNSYFSIRNDDSAEHCPACSLLLFCSRISTQLTNSVTKREIIHILNKKETLHLLDEKLPNFTESHFFEKYVYMKAARQTVMEYLYLYLYSYLLEHFFQYLAVLFTKRNL